MTNLRSKHINACYLSLILCFSMISNVFAEELKITWVQHPPGKVRLGEPFEVSWKIEGGQKVKHTNIHLCPLKVGHNCAISQGRQDGEVMTGPSNQEYKQSFAITGDYQPGDSFYAVGHAYLDEANLITTPVITTLFE